MTETTDAGASWGVTRSGARTGVALLIAILAAAVVAGLWAVRQVESGGGPAQVVQSALEVRVTRSTDPADYAPFFADPEIPQRLVDSAYAEEEATSSPIPEWETPKVTEEGTSSVTVRVVWIPDEAHEGWPAATDFILEKRDERWVIVDAQDVVAQEEEE
ncbi:MAG: hypothetical protein Kow0056_12240 [Coriobacteriia bacterium]